MNGLGIIDLAHIHVIVDDLDAASRFYREVMGFVEMQSHHDLVNRGLATYYGFGDEPENFVVSMRFLTYPGIMTLKLVKVNYRGYRGRPGYQPATASVAAQLYTTSGIGPISVRVDDLDATYARLLEYARDYSAPFKIQLLSPPVFLSPLAPHQIGTTQHSALRGHPEILDQLEKVWPTRAKVQMIDPFGVRWEFNNNVL